MAKKIHLATEEWEIGTKHTPGVVIPLEVKKYIFKMKPKGQDMSTLKAIVLELEEKFNYKTNVAAISRFQSRMVNEEDVYRTKKGAKNPRWIPDEDKHAAELYLSLPKRSNTEIWKELLSSVNKAFHKGEAVRSINGVTCRMDKLGIKRNTTKKPSVAVSFEYYDRFLRPYNMKLIAWTVGKNLWKILCLNCGQISEKTCFWSKVPGIPMGCKYCRDNPNAYAELYLTKVFCEKSGAHSKLGISKDPSNRIPSFGTTLTDTTWPDLTNSVGRKIEDQVAEKFGKYKTFPEELIGNGHTECYNTLVHEQIKEYVYQLLLDAKSSKPQNIS